MGAILDGVRTAELANKAQWYLYYYYYHFVVCNLFYHLIKPLEYVPENDGMRYMARNLYNLPQGKNLLTRNLIL